ncbi:MAG: creatininase family protein [Chloroflexi bacterium]|nr:creatininase family protein [Chloroflexota bacterium]
MLYDSRATSEELHQARIEIAILPIGAVEQHSHHLPLGTDWMTAEATARRVAEYIGAERDVYLLPALPYSLSQCHGSMPGSAWLTPKTLGDVLRDLASSLIDQGIRRIAVLNSHGGNFCLDDEICELNRLYKQAIVLNVASWVAAEGPSGRVTGGDIHAGAGETSTMLAIDPEHVRSERHDFSPSVGREFLDYATMPQISPHGVWGYPSQGSVEEGRAILDIGAERLARRLLAAFDEIAVLRGLA